MDFYYRNKEKIDRILFILSFIIIIYIFINYIFTYVAPFVVGYILALAMLPLCNLFVNRFKISRGLSSFICVILLLVLVGILGTNLVIKIIEQGRAFLANIPHYMNEISSRMENLRNWASDSYFLLPLEAQQALDQFWEGLIPAITNLLSSGLGVGSKGIVTSLPNILMTIILGVISSFFFLKDRHVIARFFSDQSPVWLNSHFKLIKQSMLTALGGYAKAQLILMCFTCMICIIGLTVIRYPYALFMGILIALIDALPVFGAGFILWPWMFFQFLSGNVRQGISLLVIYGTIFVFRQVMEPKVIGQQIGLHPLITLMSIYIGLRVFGFIGLLLGPAIVIVVKVLTEPGWARG